MVLPNSDPDNDNDNEAIAPNNIAKLKVSNGIEINSEIKADQSTGQRSIFASCKLKKPVIEIPRDNALVKFNFSSITFESGSDSKPDVKVEFEELQFCGKLSFIDYLIKRLPLNLFSNPPSVQVFSDKCELGCGLNIPPFALGMFQLTNLAVDTKLTVPLVTSQNIKFNFDFAKEASPFTLAVSGFAGFGYFQLEIAPDKTLIKASLAFGGIFEINLYVASGKVALNAGIAITYATGDKEVLIVGFVHFTGAVEVLEVASVTLDAMLALIYEPNIFYGKVTVCLRVEVACFSKSVSFELEQEFAGRKPDDVSSDRPSLMLFRRPLNKNQLETYDWNAYCGAFA